MCKAKHLNSVHITLITIAVLLIVAVIVVLSIFMRPYYYDYSFRGGCTNRTLASVNCTHVCYDVSDVSNYTSCLILNFSKSVEMPTYAKLISFSNASCMNGFQATTEDNCFSFCKGNNTFCGTALNYTYDYMDNMCYCDSCLSGIIQTKDIAHVKIYVQYVRSFERDCPVDGRPYVTQDAHEFAPSKWVHQCKGEHSSIASFSKFSTDLLTIGAPLDLVRRSFNAAMDEINHAEIACRIAGIPTESLSLPPHQVKFDGDVMGLVRSAAIEGCIHETVSSFRLLDDSMEEKDGELKALIEGIYKDEMGHSELAWDFVMWAIGRFEEVRVELSDLDWWKMNVEKEVGGSGYESKVIEIVRSKLKLNVEL